MLNQLLENIGFSPIYATEKSVKYTSPFNPHEKSPSFFVLKNREGEFKNFKDFSSGKGGDIYKFVMEYYNIGFIQAKQKLQELIGLGSDESIKNKVIQKKASLSSFKQQKKSYEVVKTQQLQNKALIDYLLERGISCYIAKDYIEEIYYKVGGKNYFGLAFKNVSEGYEVRNRYYKGCIGKKDISLFFLNVSDKRLKIFEGFMDFLSYLEINQKARLSNYLILNSLSLKERALNYIQDKFEAFELYLDNDIAGDEATSFFIKELHNASDKRIHYKSYKDINDFLPTTKTKETHIKSHKEKYGFKSDYPYTCLLESGNEIQVNEQLQDIEGNRYERVRGQIYRKKVTYE